MLKFIHLACLLFALTASSLAQSTLSPLVQPRMRVIIDNDFGGDPDGLFALAHLMLSPSVEVRAVIGSHLRAGDGFDPSAQQADHAAQKATELLKVMGLQGLVPVLAGSNTAMPNDSTPVHSAAVDFLIKEALRTDTQLPLYVLCGGGLTEIASAALTRPEIAGKLTLVWIGGPEHAGQALPPPNYTNPEYNVNIDMAATRAVFNRTQLRLWQVPRNAYRQALLPYSQLLTQVKPKGKLGAYLTHAVETLMAKTRQWKLNIGETYVVGDSPLVLLTALQSSFEADPSSSTYTLLPTPRLNTEGGYEYNSTGRNIRVYQQLDVQLMLNDFFAKLELVK
ncbi:hypothetical protein GCM10027037_25340 [Mucilaginibacter koreensis]